VIWLLLILLLPFVLEGALRLLPRAREEKREPERVERWFGW
jgi:hypothetical protein